MDVGMSLVDFYAAVSEAVGRRIFGKELSQAKRAWSEWTKARRKKEKVDIQEVVRVTAQQILAEATPFSRYKVEPRYARARGRQG
jgi:hypothetical protein